MKAMFQGTFGSPDGLAMRDLAVPALGPEDVLVRVYAPVIDRTFPLSETGAALRHVETGHARGKVVIVVGAVA